MQYDLVEQKVTRQAYATVHTARQTRSTLNTWRGRNAMDLSVDESGLWAVYLNPYADDRSRMCATRLDSVTLKRLDNTLCGLPSKAGKSIENVFVACGIVYSIESDTDLTTKIYFASDTATRISSRPNIKFVNKFQKNSMVSYNPEEKVLYAWDNHRQITYPLEFED